MVAPESIKILFLFNTLVKSIECPERQALLDGGPNWSCDHILPVSSSYPFYEWTGEKSLKTKWQFTVPGSEFFCFAGIWDRATTADGEIESYALVTFPPSPDFEKYHDRSPLVLGREDYAAWLDSPASAKTLFMTPKPFPLAVELATV